MKHGIGSEEKTHLDDASAHNEEELIESDDVIFILDFAVLVAASSHPRIGINN